MATDSLVFPLLSGNISHTLSELRRSTLSISNRLRSIISDSEHVCAVADAFGLPLIANERCGRWYVPSERRVDSVYFKSTDGHTGQWAFSSRRLNLHLLGVVARCSGCVIVDSTRRGKSMPDALSKTVPIWCAVINHALFPDRQDVHKIHVPPQVVSESELSQINGRFKTYTNQFDALALDMSRYRDIVTKPLRPIWVTQDSLLPDETPDFPEFHPIVLCTASRQVQGAEISEFGYIQGAGDDSEAWAHNLTATAFWRHRDRLMIAPEDELPALIQSLMAAEESDPREPEIRPIAQAKNVILTRNVHLPKLGLTKDDFAVFCSPNDPPGKLPAKHIRLECRNGKLGSRDLRNELYKLLAAGCIPPEGGKLYVSCPDGKDLCVGAALAIICLFADGSGNFIRSNERSMITKTVIRQRLGWITVSFPAATPSRATLQSVNDFLFSSTLLQP